VTIHRPLLARGWIVASVLYGFVRILLVWRFLSDYGIDPFVFAAIELTSSALFGWASGRLVVAVIDRDRRSRGVMALVSLAGYLAPDVYVFASAGRFPDGLLATVVTIAVVSALLTSIGIVRSIRRLR